MAALKKGRLRCSTLPIPSNYKHTDTWFSKVWDAGGSFFGNLYLTVEEAGAWTARFEA